VAEKSLTVKLLNPWQFVADFNSDLTPVIAPQGENAEILKWRWLLDKVRMFFAESPAI
jgi:hypothetical protein